QKTCRRFYLFRINLLEINKFNSEQFFKIKIPVIRKTYIGSTELAKDNDVGAAHHLIEDEIYDMV
ncbi:MAG TPA: hypothetical protein PKV46_09910, partial [Candidatus Marinimicrobia bacterium]|nr:hypothetical protein [Candidatus Neomarinimicrobiota bacterium]